MAVSMLTVAALSSAAVAAAHAGDLPAAGRAVGGLLHDWRAALPAALGGGAPVDPAAAAEAATTLQQLFYTAFVSTDLLLFVELLALQSVSATDAALIYSLEPVAGALMAYAFLGERWGAWGWAGGAVILAASMLTQLSGAKAEGGEPEPEAAAGGGKAAER
jgi:drug/metabolite transporter (DMT)-like permease